MIKKSLLLSSLLYFNIANAMLSITITSRDAESMCDSWGQSYSMETDTSECTKLTSLVNGGSNCFAPDGLYNGEYYYNHYIAHPLAEEPPLGYNWVPPSSESDYSDTYAIYVKGYKLSDLNNDCGSVEPPDTNECNVDVPDQTQYIDVTDSEISNNFSSYTNKLYKTCSLQGESACETYVAVNYEYAGSYKLKKTITQETSGFGCSASEEPVDTTNLGAGEEPPVGELLQTEEEQTDLQYCNESGGSDGVSYCTNTSSNYLCEEGQTCGELAINTPNSEIDLTKEVVKSVDTKTIQNEDGSKTVIETTTTKQASDTEPGVINIVYETKTINYDSAGNIVSEGTKFESLKDTSGQLSNSYSPANGNSTTTNPFANFDADGTATGLDGRFANSRNNVENFKQPIHDEINIEDMISKERLVSGQCPADIPINMLNTTFVIPLSLLCSFLVMIGNFILAVATFVSTRIILS